MFKTIQILISGITAAFFLTACGPSDSDAQKQGFANAAEMKVLTQRGYANYQDYVDAASRNPDLCFVDSGKKSLMDPDSFDTFCKDKKVIWVVKGGSGKNAEARDVYQLEDRSRPSWNDRAKRDIEIKSFKEKSGGMDYGTYYLIEGVAKDKGIFSTDIAQVNIVQAFVDEDAAKQKAQDFVSLRMKNKALNAKANEIDNPSYGRPEAQMRLDYDLSTLAEKFTHVGGERDQDQFKSQVKSVWDGGLTETFKNYPGKEIAKWICHYTNPTGWVPQDGFPLSCAGLGKFGFNSSFYLEVPKDSRDGLAKIYPNDKITFSGKVKSLDRKGDYGMSMTVEVTELNGQPIKQAAQKVSESTPVAPVAPVKTTSNTSATTVSDNTPFAPSFDCTKASNNAEKMICGDRNLSKLDVQLSQLYSAARNKATDKDKLKSEQIAWVKTSRACPDTACLTKAFQDRIKQLSN